MLILMLFNFLNKKRRTQRKNRLSRLSGAVSIRVVFG